MTASAEPLNALSGTGWFRRYLEDRPRLQFGITLAFAAATITILGTIFWIGYQGTDDGSYIDAALAWYRHFPLVGRSHWELRYPVIFALDASFLLFGINVFAVAASMLCYLFAVTALSVWMLQRWFGLRESVFFVVIFCTMPGVIVLSTVANADVPELFYVAASLACYCGACRGSHPTLSLVCAGILAGLAFATRETSAGLIVAYGLLFLFKPTVSRSKYLLIACGFASVVVLEMGYFVWQTGNPLWRLSLDAHHDVVDRAAALKTGQVIDREGNLSVGGTAGRFISPLLIFFATQKYGLVFYLMLASSWAVLRHAWSANQKIVLVAAATLFVAWAGFVIFNSGLLYLVPRYFLVTAWVASMICAIGLARMFELRPRLAVFLLVATLSFNAVCLYVENTDPNQPSRAAVDVAAHSRETVYTDPVTLRRGRFIAQVRGLAGRIRSGEPNSGTLYVLAPDNLGTCRSEHCSSWLPNVVATEHWKAIAQIVLPPRAIGRLLDRLKLTPSIPLQIRKKLIQPDSGVTVYRVK